MSKKPVVLVIKKNIGYATKTRCAGCNQLIEGNAGKSYICWLFKQYFPIGCLDPKG